MLRRLAVIVLVLLMAVPVLSGMSLAQDEKVLVIGHAESTDSLDPARGYTQTTGFIFRAIYQTLVTFPDDDVSAIIPMLATEWSVSEDGLTYTFKLRDDVVFSSGNPLTAADVVFSLMRLKNIQGNPAFLAANIASVTAVDDYTVDSDAGAGRSGVSGEPGEQRMASPSWTPSWSRKTAARMRKTPRPPIRPKRS